MSWRTNGMINAPLARGLALRAVGYRGDTAGFIDNSLRGEKNVDDEQVTGGRMALLWAPSEQLKLTGKAIRQKRSRGGFTAETIGAGDLVCRNPAHDGT